MGDLNTLKERTKKLVDECKFAEVLPILKEGVRQAPDDGDLWANLGWAALQLKEFNEAVEAYKQTIRISPHSDWAWRQYALALIEGGRLEEADKALQNAKSLNPDSVWLWRHYARLYKLRDNIQKEIEALEIILANLMEMVLTDLGLPITIRRTIRRRWSIITGLRLLRQIRPLFLIWVLYSATLRFLKTSMPLIHTGVR